MIEAVLIGGTNSWASLSIEEEAPHLRILLKGEDRTIKTFSKEVPVFDEYPTEEYRYIFTSKEGVRVYLIEEMM